MINTTLCFWNCGNTMSGWFFWSVQRERKISDRISGSLNPFVRHILPNITCFLRWSSLILYCTTLNASETLSHYIITSTCTDILRVHICADPSFKSNPQRHLPEQIVPLVFHTCTHTVASLSWHAASPAYCLPVIIKPTHVLFLPCINLWNHSVSLTHSQLSPDSREQCK